MAKQLRLVVVQGEVTRRDQLVDYLSRHRLKVQHRNRLGLTTVGQPRATEPSHLDIGLRGGDSPPMIKHFGGAVTLPGVSVEGIPAY